MSKLDEILNDFYCCLSTPIHFVNKKFNVLGEKGMCDDYYDMIKNTTIYKDIKENALSTLNLTYSNNISFLVVPILDYDLYRGYFIVGPFKSDPSCTVPDMVYKPAYLIDNMSQILKHIINEKLSSYNSLSSYTKGCIDYVHRNYSLDIKIDDICEHLNVNKSYFCSVFKKETGYTFTNFLNMIRVERSKRLLMDKNNSILDVALSVGYNNHNYYTTTFKKLNGNTPLEYRNNVLFKPIKN
ncbi:helix-turn-helix transcriptional regulator [Romboutsia lituseburensis]|nr:helix-turn-helix transcriptional regulator [Romboutsia lituseburensis]